MRTRSLSIVFVVVALLFSAWGNVIAAAFCPRFSLNRDCCLKRGEQQAKQVKHESSCHHEMAGMKMDDRMTETASSNGAPASCGRTPGILACADAPDTGAQYSGVQITTESLSAQGALDLPAGQCAHCQIHSQTTSENVSVVTIDPSKRAVETASLPADFAAGLTASTDLTLPSDHAPPGASSPRHLMINVFRI
jgi:hypothetical protein